jgi:hypothetical protein
MKFLILFIFSIFTFASCSDDCVKCKITAPDEMIIEEYCNDGNTNFTDQYGEEITFDVFIIQQENLGYNCE